MHRKKIMTQPEENVFANIVLNSTLCAMAYSNLIKKEDLYFKKKKKKKTTNPSLTGLYNLKKTILMKSLEKKEDPLNLFLESDSKQFFPFIQERDDLNRIITTDKKRRSPKQKISLWEFKNFEKMKKQNSTLLSSPKSSKTMSTTKMSLPSLLTAAKF